MENVFSRPWGAALRKKRFGQSVGPPIARMVTPVGWDHCPVRVFVRDVGWDHCPVFSFGTMVPNYGLPLGPKNRLRVRHGSSHHATRDHRQE